MIAPYPTTTPMDPEVARLSKLITDDERSEIEEIGRLRDTHRWMVGNRMCDKIDRHAWPVRETAIVYAAMAKYSSSRYVREMYYCSHYFQEHPALYVEFSHSIGDWDIWNFARKCKDVHLVLEHARDGYSLSDLKQMFTAAKDPEPEPVKPRFPLYARPIISFIRARVKRELWSEAEDLLDVLLGKLKEMVD